MADSNDQAAFEELFNLYFNWLKSVSMAIVKKNEDAEEIIEDVFLKLWLMRDKLHQIKNIETYLYTATKNKSFNYIKKYYKAFSVELEADSNDLGFIISPEDALIIEELKGKIESAVEILPEKCREVFLLVKEYGLSHKKAAEKLNISPKTVENQLGIAIKKIKLELEGYLSDNEHVENSNGNIFLLMCLIIFC